MGVTDEQVNSSVEDLRVGKYWMLRGCNDGYYNSKWQYSEYGLAGKVRSHAKGQVLSTRIYLRHQLCVPFRYSFVDHHVSCDSHIHLSGC